MYEKLVAFKEWCENADVLVFWLGFFTAAILIMVVQNLPPLESATADEPSQIAFEGMQAAGRMASAGLQYLEEQHLPDGMAFNPFASSPAPPVTFDDVRPDYWAFDEIELIYSYGITVGCSYDPPLYCPDRSPTRAEMAVFAARLLELMESGK